MRYLIYLGVTDEYQTINKTSSLVLLLVMSLAPGLVIAADEMTDPSKAPNISNSMELPATSAEIPVTPQTIKPSESVKPA